MLALVFPGQGSQAVGMGRELADHSVQAADVFAQADRALGEKLSDLVFHGPAEALQLTQNAQPAILTVAIAAWAALKAARPQLSPLVAAGHSLGEYAALVAAGVLSLGDAVRAVRVRGKAMQEAVPVGQGAMAAVVGLSAPEVAKVVAAVCEPAGPVAVAGLNTPDQTTISGTAAAVARAAAALKSAGARRIIPLEVSAPFHCPLMAPVEPPLRAVLSSSALSPFSFPVVSNVEATAYRDPKRTVDLLIRQLVEPVRWVESVRAMAAMGAARFVELGPGRTLSGMIKKIDPGLGTVAVSDARSLAEAVAALA